MLIQGPKGRGKTNSRTATVHVAPLLDEGAYPSPPTTAIPIELPTTPTKYNGRRPSLSPKYHEQGMMSKAIPNPPILMSKQWIAGSPARIRK